MKQTTQQRKEKAMSAERYETKRERDEAEYLDYLYVKLRTDRGIALAETDRLRERIQTIAWEAFGAEAQNADANLTEIEQGVGNLRAELAEAEKELSLSEELVNRLGKILNDTINVLRGPPPELQSWSTHDTADVARGVVEARDRARGERDEALAELEWLRRRGGE